ncbi:MAG TPA: hypothetical protein VK464_12090 [Symbiobacteriaceae bacterium]|nr:hypothetical protein [Symbiobacteriaceae bacterium]
MTEPKYERTERQLRSLLGQECPSPLQLGEWNMNLLAPDLAAQIQFHIQQCPVCEAEVAQLQGFLAADDEPETNSLWDEVKEIVLQWVQPVATPGLALAGIRGAVPRAQTFTADHLWLAITVQESEGGKKDLLALVTREDGYPLEHGTAWLSQENRLSMGGRVDARGNLVIPSLEPGVYDLGIQCDGVRVWVRGVSV